MEWWIKMEALVFFIYMGMIILILIKSQCFKGNLKNELINQAEVGEFMDYICADAKNRLIE